ncbi:transcription elongation factor GreA, partial [Lactobacillus salivarius]|nr:transcription elongation factor GreA [Ligilactobacillus salivarius]
MEARIKEIQNMLNHAEIIERIKIARSFGDLSENSEYESAKDEQAFMEARIKEIQNMLNHAEII